MSNAPDVTPHRWHLSIGGLRHRVEILGVHTRTVTWYVDDQLVAEERSSQDDVRLKPGHELDPSAGIIRVKFTDFGRPKRVTWVQGEDDVHTPGRAAVGTGGIDLDPEPGSPAALRAARMRRHPRRYAAVALAGGIAKVGIPLLVGFLMVRFTVSIPWPDWNLPSIWPDWDLPAIPWPDLHLPHWAAPAWVTWLVDHGKYVWPVLLAGVLARAEIKRQRQQDALKTQLETEAASDATAQTPTRS